MIVSDANCENQVPTVFVAAKTWVDSEAGGGWCLTMLRYEYDSTTGTMIGSPYRYPAEPSATNYFVPTAMTIHQYNCTGSDAGNPTNTWIVVTGYGPSVAYGNTDYHTVCFNGNLTVRWSHTYGRPGVINDVDPVDEYAVAIDHAAGVNYITSSRDPVGTEVAGITGNTWNGSTWDVQTIFYDILNGVVLGVLTAASSDDDLACGIRMFGDETGSLPNARSYVVGTQGPSLGNTITAIRYTADSTSAGGWVTTSRSVSVSGATIKANAMQADFEFGTSGDFAFAAGKLAGIDQSHMFLAKFDFYGDTTNYPYGENGYYTSFSYEANSTAPRFGEALCMDYLRTTNVGTLIALGGYNYRDSSHGTDSVVALFHESSGQPVLRWSAWTNLSDTAYNVLDVCTGVAIARDLNGVSSLDDFYIHCAAQLPISTTDMDLRAIVFNSSTSSTPEDPGSKGSSGSPVDLSGTAAGGDIPRFLELVNGTVGYSDTAHNFIVIGDVWNGSTNGFDVLTRRFRFTEPQ